VAGWQAGFQPSPPKEWVERMKNHSPDAPDIAGGDKPDGFLQTWRVTINSSLKAEMVRVKNELDRFQAL
jgi:hypothetical protein